METIYMKCQILLSGKSQENIVNLSPSEFAQGGLRLTHFSLYQYVVVNRNQNIEFITIKTRGLR